MTTMIPNIKAVRGDYIDIEMNYKRTDITGYSIRALMYDSNQHAYQKLGLSVVGSATTSSLAQDYNFKVNAVEYTITTTASMSYSQIATLMNTALGRTYTCEIVGTEDMQDIKITHNTKGPNYSVAITAGDTEDLLTLLSSTPSTAHAGIPHVIRKGSVLVSGGSDSQITWIDTRAAYQELGLDILGDDSPAFSGTNIFDFTLNDTVYTLASCEDTITYTELVALINDALINVDFTCTIVDGDVRISSDNSGDSYEVAITAGTTNDLLDALGSTPSTAIEGYTNTGWYNIYIDAGETANFTGDAFVEIEVADPSGNKVSQLGIATIKKQRLEWSVVA